MSNSCPEHLQILRSIGSNFSKSSGHVLSCAQHFVTLWTTRLLCPWDFQGKSTGVGCHFLLQGIFMTQGPNPCLLCLLHCRQGLYPLSYRGSPPRAWALHLPPWHICPKALASLYWWKEYPSGRLSSQRDPVFILLLQISLHSSWLEDRMTTSFSTILGAHSRWKRKWIQHHPQRETSTVIDNSGIFFMHL